MKRHIILLVAAVGALAACGDDSGSSDQATTTVATTSAAAATTAAAPATTASATTAPAADAPKAIVSLSPTATEMLFAIGAGEQVKAVDNFSNYPEEAIAKQQGLDAFQPNVEAIAGLEPDLVVTDGTNADLLSQFDTLKIPHYEGKAATTFEDIYTQIEQLGAITGHVGEATQLVGEMQTDIQAALDSMPTLTEPLTYYHELGTDLYSVTSDTFIGSVYTAAGLTNIADAVGDGNPYPQLSAEFILSADPDLIFLACTKYCGETPETVAGRPGWSDLAAVKNSGVIAMDDDIASRWGPRIVDYIEAVASAVGSVEHVGG